VIDERRLSAWDQLSGGRWPG